MIPTIIVFLAVFGLAVYGSYEATDRLLAWNERRKMQKSIERMKVVVGEYAALAEKERA